MKDALLGEGGDQSQLKSLLRVLERTHLIKPEPEDEPVDKVPANMVHQRSLQQPTTSNGLNLQFSSSTGNTCFSPLLSHSTKTSQKARTILKTGTFQYKEHAKNQAPDHTTRRLDRGAVAAENTPHAQKSGDENVCNSSPSPNPVFKGGTNSPIRGVKSLQIQQNLE